MMMLRHLPRPYTPSPSYYMPKFLPPPKSLANRAFRAMPSLATPPLSTPDRRISPNPSMPDRQTLENFLLYTEVSPSSQIAYKQGVSSNALLSHPSFVYARPPDFAKSVYGRPPNPSPEAKLNAFAGAQFRSTRRVPPSKRYSRAPPSRFS